MPTSHHSFDEPAPLEADHPRIPETPEDVIDRVGIRLAMLVLCVACLIAALSVLSTPSFEKCTVLTSASECLLRGAAGGFFKTPHAMTSKAKARADFPPGAGP
jgi:hypothetical protein